MRKANIYAKFVMADEKAKNAAQVRLNVTRNKLYTTLIKEYFANAQQGTGEMRKK